MEFGRNKYIEKLKRLNFVGGVKIITGVRRCGKSYLLFNLYYKELISSGIPEDHIITIGLDSIENKSLCDAEKLYQHIMCQIKDNEQYYIMIDEIQLVDDFVSVVNSLLRKKNLDVYITGSNSKFLSSEIVTEFRGRGTEINVRPLSFSEFYSSTSLEDNKAWHTYLSYGGMPEIVKLAEEDKINSLENLISVVYLRDIVERKKVQHPDILDTVFNMLSSAIGSLTNPNRIANQLKNKKIKVDNKTITEYIGHFKDAFLFEESKRFDIKGREYIDTPSKWYSIDLGLRNARIGFRQNEFTHLMENAIYNELRYRGFSVDVGVIGIREYIQRKRNYKQLEIDFVANKGDKRYYIQSAYRMDDEEKVEHETRPFLKINDGFRKIIVVGDNVPTHTNNNGITIMNVFDFMKDENSLDRI